MHPQTMQKIAAGQATEMLAHAAAARRAGAAQASPAGDRVAAAAVRRQRAGHGWTIMARALSYR